MRNYVTIGVYDDGSCIVNIVRSEDLEKHIKYNENFRPGRMLFVDGKFRCGGVLSESEKRKRISVWEEKIKDMNFNTRKDTRQYA